ncbi:MAG: LCP family protein [Lachnospiraceae bacterium]|nr:LCP family protein [Lachnospiraceae bacterium]
MAQKRKKKGGNKVVRNVIIGVEAVVLIAVVVILIFVWRATDQEGTGATKYNLGSDPEELGVNEEIVNDPTVKEIRDQYTTLAFFGVDARNGTLNKGTRTDTIILCSINNETGETRLCSVYRDTLLNIGTMDNPSYTKCNAAYAYGGPEKAIAMLNQNLDLYITQFVTVGFDGVMNTVDALGGVDIDIQQNEIKFLNDYQASMYSTETNTVITDNYVPVTDVGMQTLSGYQALAYCRIRYTAGSDFKRTERQRDVVSQIVYKAKQMDPAKITRICNDVFPYIATNMDLNDDIIPMASQASKYSIVASSGFPFDDKITTGLLGAKGDCVIPVDLEANVVDLHEFLYPGITYTPSENVKTISSTIKAEAARYLGN